MLFGILFCCFAEEEGFEPSVPLPVRQFSKLFLSATQASLRFTQRIRAEGVQI
jgi:hypothetical protein